MKQETEPCTKQSRTVWWMTHDNIFKYINTLVTVCAAEMYDQTQNVIPSKYNRRQEPSCARECCLSPHACCYT